MQRFGRNNKKVDFKDGATKSQFLKFARGQEARWKANFRDLKRAVARMATLAKDGIIDTAGVQAEIEELHTRWVESNPSETDDSLLAKLLGPERLAARNRFDRFQLAGVVRVCQKASSGADAGRRLFATPTSTPKNVSSRLTKYLKRFELTFQQCQTGVAS